MTSTAIIWRWLSRLRAKVEGQIARRREVIAQLDTPEHRAAMAREYGRDGLGTVTVEEITPEIEAKAVETFRRAAEEHGNGSSGDET